MDIPRGTTQYKKKDGILTLTENLSSLIWTPLPGTGNPTLSIPVHSITNLQQTPVSNPKVILKIVAKPKGQEADGEPVAYLFQFVSQASARPEADAVKEILSSLIQGKNDAGNLLRPADGNDIGAARAAAHVAATKWLDDETLLGNADLQKALLDKDAKLRQTYEDALATKPDSVPAALFSSQFWSTRVGLLRAYAIENSQRQGAYNVLAVVKPKTVDDTLRLNLSVGNIRMIFQHFPVVAKLYDETVPKRLDEAKFWERFFNSRLFKRLKGERVKEEDHNDPIFDRYDEDNNTLLLGGRSGLSRISARQQMPHTLDLEGNEEDLGGFKGGNRPDVEMRAGRNQKTVRALNSLSEMIMALAAPVDKVRGPTSSSSAAAIKADAGASVATPHDDDDLETNHITLRDLRGDADVEGMALNIKDQSRLLPQAEAPAVVLQEKVLDPMDVLFLVNADMDTLDDDGAGGLDLHKGLGIDDDSDDDDDDSEGEGGNKPPQAHVGSRAARRVARDQILDGMRKQRAELYADDKDDETNSPMGIPRDLAQKCFLTSATTTEFLKQFWQTFLQGDAGPGQPTLSAADEEIRLAHHVAALRKCKDRIRALADEAQATHAKRVAKSDETVKAHFKKTGKKLRPLPIRGGREEVMALFESTLTGLNTALDRYKRASR